MAPRRGGGGGSSGGSSGGSYGGSSGSGYSGSDGSSSGFDDSYATPYDDIFAALCAVLAFAVLLLLTAVAAAVMVFLKSWLRQTGTRNIPRLALFLSFLLLIILSRALQIALIATEIRAANSYSAYLDLDPESLLDIGFASTFFDLTSLIVLFVIATIETYRGSGLAAQKISVLEMANYAVIGFLLIIGIAAFGEDTDTALKLFNYSSDYYLDYDIYGAIEAVRGLTMTFVVIGFLFTSSILVRSLAVAPVEPSSPSRKLYLTIFAAALWVHQIFLLALEAIILFGTTGDETTSSLALQVIRYVLLIVIIIAITLLAWNSHSTVRSNGNTTATTTAPASQPPVAMTQVEKAPEGYAPDTTTIATVPQAQPPVHGSDWQTNYDSTNTMNAATTTFRPSAGAP